MAWAPAPPADVEIEGVVSPSTTLKWRIERDIIGKTRMFEPLTDEIPCIQITGCGTHLLEAEPAGQLGPDGAAIAPLDPRWLLPQPFPESMELPRPEMS